MDFLYIEKICKELNKKLKKERIFNIFHEEKKMSIQFKDFFLNVYFGQPNAIFLSKKAITQKVNPLFNSLKNVYIKSVSLPVIDRVLEIEIVKVDLNSKIKKFFTIFELTGKNANFFLLDEDRKIILTLREVKSSVRPLEKGDVYTFPPQEKMEFQQIQFGEITKEGIEKKLHKYVLGISPLNAKEIAHLFENFGNLEKAYQEFLQKHKSSEKAYLYYEKGKPKYMTTFFYESLRRLEAKEFSGNIPYNDCWKTFYLEKVKEEKVESIKKKLLNDLEKRIEAIRKELQSLKTKEVLLKEAEENRRLGELLKYNLHLVKPGIKKVKVFDYYTNKDLEIPVDPSISPQKNVEKYFSKYRKLKRKAEYEETLRKKLEEELLELEFLKENIREKKTLEGLQDFLPEKEKKDKERKKSFRIYTLPSGKKVIVGRSNKENEFLSLKLANPWDIWFHAKNIPGSHVILRLNKGEKPLDEDILLSAAIAAFFSKGKHSGKVTVDYTEAKNLKKPRGTPTGFVIYENEKTIIVDPNLFLSIEKSRKSEQ
jgi:predicted ribosome quality control (RQC) complex YloA/Tae2 family protein